MIREKYHVIVDTVEDDPRVCISAPLELLFIYILKIHIVVLSVN